MKKFQVNFIEVHTVNIGGVEKDILAFQVATINEISKKQIIDNYYNNEDNQDFVDRLDFEKTDYPDYPNLVTDILDVHSRAIVSIQEIGDIEIDKENKMKSLIIKIKDLFNNKNKIKQLLTEHSKKNVNNKTSNLDFLNRLKEKRKKDVDTISNITSKKDLILSQIDDFILSLNPIDLIANYLKKIENEIIEEGESNIHINWFSYELKKIDFAKKIKGLDGNDIFDIFKKVLKKDTHEFYVTTYTTINTSKREIILNRKYIKEFILPAFDNINGLSIKPDGIKSDLSDTYWFKVSVN